MFFGWERVLKNSWITFIRSRLQSQTKLIFILDLSLICCDLSSMEVWNWAKIAACICILWIYESSSYRVEKICYYPLNMKNKQKSEFHLVFFFSFFFLVKRWIICCCTSSKCRIFLFSIQMVVEGEKVKNGSLTKFKMPEKKNTRKQRERKMLIFIIRQSRNSV